MDAIRNTLAENFGGIGHAAAKPENKFDIEKDIPDLSGKVAVVTGGSEGIGYGASFMMLKNNLQKLFILSVNNETLKGALDDITEKLGAPYAQKVTWIKCDLGDLTSVTTAAKQISDSTDRIDIVICNAARGVMTYQGPDSNNPVDRHMLVNHVAHVTLVSHLMPVIKKTAEGLKPREFVRIQTQASNAHEMSPKDTKFASIEEMNQDLGPNGQYGRSKLAQLLYARYLDRHLHSSHPNILINATHPGFVETKMSNTDIHEPYPILGYGMSVLMAPLKKDQWEGAASTLYAATATENSGEYVCPPKTIEPGSDLARDAELGEQLQRLTKQIVREKYGSVSVDKGCPLKDY